VHSFYEIYGSEKAGELLTALARVFALYLQSHGFTVGLDDLVIKPEYNKQRRMTIENAHKEGVIAAAKFTNVSGGTVKKLNYSNRVVHQSEKNMDKDIEKLTQMALPKNPFDGNKKVMTLDDPIRIGIEKKIGQSSSKDMEELEKELDNVMKNTNSKATSKILKECIPDGLIKRFPKNNISAMVLTGAKGGVVNQTQISTLLGQ
jgi:DNA-directed RNA polymerase I subunit RPA1